MSGPSGQYLLPAQHNPVELYRRPSPENDGRAVKRPRASRPKVKSGCITCKTRRVKCDETKPHCLRCQKFGRVCDGYTPDPSPSRGLIQLQPRIPSTSLYRPSVSIHVTEEESRYFQVFADRAAHELSGFFDDTFWTRLVLQESHNVAAIRHAVIALGALNKSLETAPKPQLKVNVIQSIDKKHHEQAVFQYLKAIQALNQYISESASPQLRNALIACLLFVCFETFQGCYASSVQQTYGGLKILRGYYQGKPGSRPWIPQHGRLSSTKSRRNSQADRIQLGCESIHRDTVIASHVEDYLGGTQSYQQTELALHVQQADEFGRTEREGHHLAAPARTTVTEPDIYTGKPRTMSMFSLHDTSSAQSSDSGSLNLGQPRHHSLPPTDLRRSSLAMPSSVVSTPPSTNPQTPTSLPPNPGMASTRKRSLSSRTPTPPLLQNDLHVEEILIQNFVRLDGHGLFFGMVPGIPPLIWDVHKIWHIPIPTSFPSYASAQRCWDFLMDRCLQFYRRTLFNRAYARQNQESGPVLARQHSEYMDQLSAFERAFQPTLEAAISPDGSIAHAPSLILSLYQKCTVIALTQIPAPSEMVYDSFLTSFEYIVRTCTLLISSESTIQTPKNRRFSFEVGIIPPLHVTATKCRDPGVRRQAVELLFGSPRQEGMWDSVLSARIGRWLIGCEEDGLDPPVLDERRNSMFAGMAREMGGIDKGQDVQIGYPSPPNIVDEMGHGGGWEGGRKISEVVNVAIGRGPHGEGADSEPFSSNTMNLPKRGGRKRKGSGEKESWVEGTTMIGGQDDMRKGGWMVPEKNRVQLTVVSFHVPDRYIKVKCQKAIANADGIREERETVIAW